MVDDFCHFRPQKKQHPGPDASLSPSEVITLAIFARWARFTSERDFYRYASARLSDAFPTLPERSQFNRLLRHSLGLIEEIALHLADVMKVQRCPYQALDSSAMPVRDAKRRGEGWLACSPVVQTLDGAIGWDGTRGSVCLWPQIPRAWSRALASVPLPSPTSRWPRPSSPCGTQPSAAERRIGLLFGSLRGLLKGFEGEENHRRWLDRYGVRLIHSPKRNSGKRSWPKRLRRWVGPEYARSSRASTTSSSTPSASGGSGPMSWKACEPVWRRGGSVAQLLHLAQRSPWSPPLGICRPVGMVISKLTPSV
jgi:hypothetical protein